MDSVMEVTMKATADHVVALERALAAPRGPNAVWLPCPPKAAEISPLFPLAALSALQEDHYDDEKADHNVNESDECNHEFKFFLYADSGLRPGISRFWCGRGDLNYSIPLITRNLLILHPAERPKGPTIPIPLYVYCTANALRKRKPKSKYSLFLAAV